MSSNEEKISTREGRSASDARPDSKTQQFSSSGVIIGKRQKSSTDIIRKSSNSRILE